MVLDPITYEVVRHRFWQINEEQSATIRLMSCSPIVVEANDFNTAILTHRGDLAVIGQCIRTHAGSMGAIAKNVIALAAEISDGDAFLVNDPYLGAVHQRDIALLSPIFSDNRPIIWVANIIHHMDVGGSGIKSRNVYEEEPRYFLKLVDRGKFSKEVEHTVMTNSRLPESVALDLRAQLGACNVAKRRLLSVIDEYGTDTIVEVMDRLIDQTERQLRALFKDLPDGTWYHEVYMDGLPRDPDRIARVCLTLEKRGDELIFDYMGSDPQIEGYLNSTYDLTYTVTMFPIYNFLCRGAVEWNDAFRHCVKVTAPKGTVVNAQIPAAVSIGHIWGFAQLASIAATKVIAKMLLCSEKHRELVCPSWGVAGVSAPTLVGYRGGEMTIPDLPERRATGAGARSFGDGFDHAGMISSHVSYLTNAEDTERMSPVLYIFRRQLKDSGGPGKYRGGLSTRAAFTPHGIEKFTYTCFGYGTDQSNSSGIAGGYPGAGSQVTIIRNTELWTRWRSGVPFDDYAEFGGVIEHLQCKGEQGDLYPGDVVVSYAAGGGGYGDPLDREPASIARDIVDGKVSERAALEIYGVVFDKAKEVDIVETGLKRREIIEDRLREGHIQPVAKRRDITQGIQEYLELDVKTGKIRCPKCQYLYCNQGEDVSKFAFQRQRPLNAAGPWLAKRWGGNSPNFVLVESICPSCGMLFDVTETLKADLSIG